MQRIQRDMAVGDEDAEGPLGPNIDATSSARRPRSCSNLLLISLLHCRASLPRTWCAEDWQASPRKALPSTRRASATARSPSRPFLHMFAFCFLTPCKLSFLDLS